MIFQSVDYLVFFVVVFAGYWMLPHRGQNILLLAASYFFYGYVHPWYLAVVMLTTVVDFTSARMIEILPEKKRLFLGATLTANFGVLATFKYFGFFVSNIHAALALAGWRIPEWTLHLALPVGISFYTFQNVAYVVDVFRGETRACRNFLDYALFGTFFPQLVAGPIERAKHLLAQVGNARQFSFASVQSGLLLILWGLFKKLVIADNLAVLANKAFGLEHSSFAIVWAGVFAFSIQIYADFSAYTDIARGSARLLGFSLIQNFNHPYIANSPADFWRRWHISLSNWFRDYVYIPLGGGRASKLGVARNVMITFLISGLWHGASWNFILWGFYWGLLLVLWRFFEKPGKPVKTSAIRNIGVVVLTFTLTNIGWLFFREQSIHRIAEYLTLNPFSVPVAHWRAAAFFIALTAIHSIPLWLHALWELKIRPMIASGTDEQEPNWTWTLVQSVIGLILFVGVLTLASDVGGDFIYFQF